MAFNFGGFMAGVADAAVSRMEKVEEEKIRIAREKRDEERQMRSIGTRQRMAREEERRKKQALLDESAGMLAMLGYTEDNINAILSKGTAASEFAITAGQTAMTKGVDPNSIWNFSTNEAGETDQKKVEETIDIAQPSKVGDITATSSVAPSLPTRDTGSGIINLDAYRDLFAEPEKVESSFSARLAVISQQLARDPDRKNAAELRAEQEKLLNDLRTMKEAEREDKGNNTPSFRPEDIRLMEKEVRNAEYRQFGFKLNMNDEIENMDDGNIHLSYIAGINIARTLNGRNQGINDDRLGIVINQVRDDAINNLTQYGYQAMYNESEKFMIETDFNTFQQKYEARQYSVGDVVKFENSLFVYTNAVDHLTGMRFVKIADNLGM